MPPRLRAQRRQPGRQPKCRGGRLARALIRRFATERRAADGIYRDEGLHDVDGRPLDWLDDSARVELWHPIGRPVDEVLAWRDWRGSPIWCTGDRANLAIW